MHLPTSVTLTAQMNIKNCIVDAKKNEHFPEPFWNLCQFQFQFPSFLAIYSIMSFIHLTECRSISNMSGKEITDLVTAIVQNRYDPETFYRDFSYAKPILNELILEYIECCNELYEQESDDYDQCAQVLHRLWTFKEALASNISQHRTRRV